MGRSARNLGIGFGIGLWLQWDLGLVFSYKLDLDLVVSTKISAPHVSYSAEGLEDSFVISCLKKREF